MVQCMIQCLCVHTLVSHNRVKHPVKVHVWKGISLRKMTSVCIFEGKMNVIMYVNFSRNSLKPFLDDVILTPIVLCRMILNTHPS